MIRLISDTEIENIKRDAKRSGLVFAKNTIYFGYIDNDKILGIGGLLIYKTKAVFKNFYVLPEHRGYGIHKSLLNHCIEYALSRGIKYGEATCTKMALNEYISRGFKVKQKYKHYWKVSHEDLSKSIRI